MAESSSARSHHRHLEQTRAQVVDLLSRQEIERELVQRSWQRNPDIVSHLLQRQQRAALEARLWHLHPADIAFVLESLEPEARAFAWSLVRPERRGAVLLEISDEVRAALVGAMAVREIAAVARSLGSKEIAQLLATLPEDVRSAVFAELDQADQTEVRTVLSFPSGSVGAAMDLEHLTVHLHDGLGDVHAQLRRLGELPRHTAQLYVIDDVQHLRGVLELTRLLLDPPERTVAEAMQEPPRYFYTDDPMHEAVLAFDKYALVAAPVVNLHEQLVGRITVDAVVEALHERAHDDGLRQVGLSRVDEDLRVPLVQAARRRWPWLAVNLASAFLASRVIGAFEPLIAQLAALAALMPIVASIGGNAGNQSVALVLQGLSHGEGFERRILHSLWRETRVGALNGAMLGPLLGLVILTLYADFALAAVTALAMFCNLVFAAAVGVAAPVVLARLGRDPVMGSSIFVTASTDSFGFFVLLGLAGLLLT